MQSQTFIVGHMGQPWGTLVAPNFYTLSICNIIIIVVVGVMGNIIIHIIGIILTIN
jgi:hypothetical protein|nr:MAG TPA: hypothetical protein [Caudoviricetes sp.]